MSRWEFGIVGHPDKSFELTKISDKQEKQVCIGLILRTEKLIRSTGSGRIGQSIQQQSLKNEFVGQYLENGEAYTFDLGYW